MVNHLSTVLHLSHGVISSHWDMAHLNELAVKTAIRDDQTFDKTCEYIGDKMKEHRSDKKGLFFSEAADKIKVPELKNRLICRTRFGRDHLEFLKVAVRNAAVFYEMLKEKLDKTDPRDNRAKDSLKTELKKFTDAKMWIRIIGYIQIFSLISEFSILVQSSAIFPTTALRKLDEFLKRLAALGEPQISGNLRV